jgi:glucokinase
LTWYQSVLTTHISTIMAKAHTDLDTFGVRLGGKMPGIHWHYDDPSVAHEAEDTAGLYNYSAMIDQFKNSNADLAFTALELQDNNVYPYYGQPQELVQYVANLCNQKGVPQERRFRQYHPGKREQPYLDGPLHRRRNCRIRSLLVKLNKDKRSAFCGRRDMTTTLSEQAIGVDIGGTKINIGIMDRSGNVAAELTVPSLAKERRVVEQVIAGIRNVVKRAEDQGMTLNLKGIGVGSAGQIDHASGTVHFANDLMPGYTGTPIRELLEREFSLPVYVDNDVNVLALAEKRFGSGKHSKHMVCIALGTGVGGALLSDGKLVRGATGGAGEIGHMTVDFRGPRCICGNMGCLELYASGTSIERRMNELLKNGEGADALTVPDAQAVFARWRKGDPVAAQVIDEAINALSAAIASLIHIVNPDTIVIGGGVAESGEAFFAKIRNEVKRRAMPSMYQNVRIEAASSGSRSGMLGAAQQLWE